MKKLHRFLSAVLCIVMIAAMAVSASASDMLISANPNSTVSLPTVKELLEKFNAEDYTKLDLAKADTWSWMTMNNLTPAHEYTTHLDEDCIQLKHSGEINPENAFRWLTSSGETVQYALSIYPSSKENVIPTDHKYMVITYSAETANRTAMYLHSFKADSFIAIPDVSVSKGKWTCSDIIDVPAGFYERFNGPNYVAFWLNEVSTDAKIYIDSITFFKNKADAEEYTKWAPIYMDPNGEETLNKLQQREENRGKLKIIMGMVSSVLSNKRAALPYTPLLPFEGIGMDKYTVVEWNETNIRSMDAGGANAEHRPAFTEYSGVNCIQMYSQALPGWGVDSGFNAGIAPAVKSDDTLEYVIVKYASVADAPYALWFWAPGNGEKGFSKICDVPAGITGWSHSPILPVSEGLAARVTSGMQMSIVADKAPANSEIYIASMMFFKTQRAAERYLEQYEEYHEFHETEEIAEPTVDPITEASDGYYRMSFTKDATGFDGRKDFDTGYTPTFKADYVDYNSDGTIKYRPAANVSHIPLANARVANLKYMWNLNSMQEAADRNGKTTRYGEDFPEFTTYNGIECAKPVKCDFNNNYGGAYGFAFDVNTGHTSFNKNVRKYAVITYATPASKQINFGLAWGGLNMTSRTIYGAYPADGWTSVAFELIGAWESAINRPKLGIYSNDEFYIRELVFFETKADAEAYAAKAPAFFNGEEYDADAVIIPSNPLNFIGNAFKAYTFDGSELGTTYVHGYQQGKYAEEEKPDFINDGPIPYASVKYNWIGWNLYPSLASPLASSVNGTPHHYFSFTMLLRSSSNVNSLTIAPNYMVVVYDSNASTNHKLILGAIGGTTPAEHALADVKANTSGWRVTAPYDIATANANSTHASDPNPLVNRIRGNKFALGSSAHDGYLNIHNMVFFENADDAREYASMATEYYKVLENLGN